ncbi:MAG: hypothetical protein DHS20C09_19980 [marine bacterium B5-7]|nr:MAG: hypothetical protein DHS20C09_19980 [marine bacterium B5-7]
MFERERRKLMYLEYTQPMKNKNPAMGITLMLLLILSQGISARMYQWVEADTGTTQLSGKPPMWYRSASSGPRIFVFDNGRLIDDTALEVDDDVREQLRQRAFVLVEKDQQKAKDKLAKSLELKQKYDEDKSKKTELKGPEKVLQENLNDEDLIVDEDYIDDEEKADSTENTVDELRQLITEWENAQTENAKKALEQ